MTDKYDVVIMGAGPAGYVAAIRCAQLGLNTACVDNWLDSNNKPVLGGTCLNVGCIPSKSLLESSELFAHCQHGMTEHGITLGKVSLDLAAMMSRKEKVVSDLTNGIEALFKANKVTWIKGRGRLLINKQVEITSHDDKVSKVAADNVIIATGSSPINISSAPCDGEMIVNSTGALAFTEVPKRLGVIGAGVIGLELGSVWKRLGAEVVMIEAQEEFLSIADAQIAKEAQRAFGKQGMDIRLGARLVSADIQGKDKSRQVAVKYQDSSGEHGESFDKLIVAVGRQPNSHRIFETATQLVMDERGFIHVNMFCETSIPGVYAIGDLVRGPMLAHKGSEEGIMVAERIAGHAARVNYDLVPSVIYTQPEIAWAGKTEQQLKSSGEKYRAGIFPFAASGRARAMGDTSGMVKILAQAETDRILGVHIIGPQASELIAQAVIAMEMGASSEDIALTMFAHPTLAESFHEAALAVQGRAIHIAQKRSNK
jgi:dihydrolipoamide dehydrogenase